jgi:hypothetical protein
MYEKNEHDDKMSMIHELLIAAVPTAVLVDCVYVIFGFIKYLCSCWHWEVAVKLVVNGWWLPVVAGCCRWLPVVAGGCRWLPVVAGGCRWSPVVAGGRRWSPVVAGGRRWSPVVAGGRRWLPVVAGCCR